MDADSWVERTKCVTVYMVPQICRKPFLRHDSLESAQWFPGVLIANSLDGPTRESGRRDLKGLVQGYTVTAKENRDAAASLWFQMCFFLLFFFSKEFPFQT